ncbi:hypothetical protein ACTFIU_008528 [Dictyostelium citrinum]
MFRCSSSSLLCGNNVTFTIVYNTQPGEILFITGSMNQLGEWDTSKAKRMTWNVGNLWDASVGFPESVYIQYKYFVYNEINKTYRWESIENRQLIVNNDELLIEDAWDVKRNLQTEQTKDTDSTPNSLNSNSSNSFLFDSRISTMLE